MTDACRMPARDARSRGGDLRPIDDALIGGDLHHRLHRDRGVVLDEAEPPRGAGRLLSLHPAVDQRPELGEVPPNAHPTRTVAAHAVVVASGVAAVVAVVVVIPGTFRASPGRRWTAGERGGEGAGAGRRRRRSWATKVRRRRRFGATEAAGGVRRRRRCFSVVTMRERAPSRRAPEPLPRATVGTYTELPPGGRRRGGAAKAQVRDRDGGGARRQAPPSEDRMGDGEGTDRR
eukprot:gene10856-biopygen3815